jgi:hypothetical protein
MRMILMNLRRPLFPD